MPPTTTRKDYRRKQVTSPYGPAACRRQGSRRIAGIYLRLSHKTDESTSPERQLAACLAKADERDYDVPEGFVFEDIDVSAFRTALDDRLELARLRLLWCELDALIFFKLDRLIRSTRDFAVLCDEAAKFNCVLLSATEGAIDTEGFGKVLAQIAAIFAELEAETISLRTTSSIKHLREIGRWKGGTRPFGLMPVPNPNGAGRVLAIQAEEAALVCELAERVLAGESLRKIAHDWTARDIPTRHGAPAWTFRVLCQILRNPVYIGQQVHHGEVMVGPEGMPHTPHPAILDLATWQQVQAELDKRQRGWTPRTRSQLLAGFLTCHLCGRNLHSGGQPTDRMRNYRCSARNNGGDCPGVSISAAHVEPHLTTLFLDRIGDATFVQRIDRPAPQNLQPQIDAVREAMAALMAARFDPNRAFTGQVGDDLFDKQAQALQGRMDGLLAQQASLPEAGTEWVPTDRTIRQEWESRDLAGRRAMLASFYVTVGVERGMKGSKRFNPARVHVQAADDLGLDPAQTIAAGEPLRPPLPAKRTSRRANAFVSTDPKQASRPRKQAAPDAEAA